MDLRLKGNMNIVKGKLKEKYGKLTDSDLAVVEGQEDQLIGILQKKLGKTKEEVISVLNELQNSN